MKKKTTLLIKRASVLVFGCIVTVGGALHATPTDSKSLTKEKQLKGAARTVATLIKGKVVDQAGLPLAGVTVAVKGSSTATSTDGDGNFQINVTSEKDVLVISIIGFESREITVGSNKSFNIILKEKSTTLNEVVVVGYSAKKTKEISSAVTVVTSDKLRDVTSNELTTLLQGKAPGVLVSSSTGGDPTSSGDVVIRGVNTITASSSPLYVVDGNIGGSYNVADVESVTILKDAAATGLYGSRASNGIIIVTTKSGKAGKTKVEFNATTGLSQAEFGNFKVMNAQQLFDYQSLYYNPDPSVVNINTNWRDLAFRNAIVNNYQLALNGGTEKTQFYLSGNYYNEEGTVLGNDKTGYNFRLNLTHNVNTKFKVATHLNGTFTKDNYYHDAILKESYVNMPFDSPYGADGAPVEATSIVNWFGRDRENFLHSYQYNLNNARSLNVNGDLNLDYTLSKLFTLSSYNRMELGNYRAEQYSDKRTKEGAGDGGWLYNGNSFNNRLLTSNRLKYEQSFGSHNVTALAVAEAEKSYSDNTDVTGQNLPPGRPFLSTATTTNELPGGGRDESSFQKGLVSVDYNYNNRYFAIASLVHESSSRFGSNNPGADFYQLGASWILSNESFMSGVTAVNFLKLRSSYGTTGNADFGNNYAALGLYDLSAGSSYAGLPGAAPSQKANPNLTWEKLKSTNIGVDVGFLNRIDLNIDVYQKVSSDLLYKRPLPATSGYDYIFENVGSIRNRGVEFNLTTTNLKGKFSWVTNLNVAVNRNKVLSLNDGATEFSAGAAQPIAVGHDMNEWYMRKWVGVDPNNGDPLWEQIVKDADGKEFVSYTNSWNSATPQYTGKSSQPKFTGGFTNTFSYKNWSLSAFANFVYGNKVYNGARAGFDTDGLYESYNAMVLADGWNRWEKPGDIATHPKPVYGGNHSSNSTSTRFLEDGSYIRLRNVKLSYDLPKALLSRINVTGLRFYMGADNLLTITKFSGPNPEVIYNNTDKNSSYSSGSAGYYYPQSRKLLFGMNLSF
ncbi:SusC/RagA family TonB-linked outer membrane protein [Solitalea sp. MAHUQ-68]|uniref:SusC/RagA family TonB-linked outer membrane protein n=1 Tax=Solitalea agri TaxID=2953739 RepID=A0A9X2JCN1_9SPHI|nr:SusC/RagA family TonB-linked outer membrane protein [Solitalea agri]MCO4292704.1 SusC/RagA family TonB-linked outer membrane protein [Solitalea agri]